MPTKLDVTKVYDDLPPGKWTKAVGGDLLGFGGLTYFFAKQLYQKYKIPIGIINSSVGGYPIESWMSADALVGISETGFTTQKLKGYRLHEKSNHPQCR